MPDSQGVEVDRETLDQGSGSEPSADAAESNVRYRFAGFLLDPELRRLRAADGRETELTPRQVDVLLQLLRRPGELLERGALLDAVWGDVAVTDASLTQTVSTLRRELDDADDQLIVTVPKAGYRLDATVEVERVELRRPEATDDASSAVRSSLPGSDPPPAGARRGLGGLPGRALGLPAVVVAIVVVVGVATVALLSARAPFASDGSDVDGAGWMTVSLVRPPASDDVSGETPDWIHDAASRLLEARLRAHPSLRLEPSGAAVDRELTLEVTSTAPGATTDVALRLEAPPDLVVERTAAIEDLVAAVGALTAELVRRLELPAAPGTSGNVPVEALRAYTEGVRLAERHRPAEARARLEAALALAPDFGLAHLALAEELRGLGYRQLALSHAKAALELEPLGDDLASLRIRAAYYEIAGDWQAACTDRREALDHFADEASRLSLARCLIVTGRPREALRRLDEAPAPPRDVFSRFDGLWLAAESHASLGETERAIELATEAVEVSAEASLDRRHLDALRQLARLELYGGDRQAALETMRRAAELFEASGDVLAALEIEQDLTKWTLLDSDPAAARRVFLEQLEVARSRGHTHLEGRTLAILGSALAQMGRLRESRERLEEALALFVELGDEGWQRIVRIDLARRQAGLGAMDAAAADLEDLVAAESSITFYSWYLHNELIAVERFRGRFREALEHADAALAAAAGDDVALKRRYSQCERATVLVHAEAGGEAAAALSECRRLARGDAGDPVAAARLEPLPVLDAMALVQSAVLRSVERSGSSAEALDATELLDAADALLETLDTPAHRALVGVEWALTAALAGETERAEAMLGRLAATAPIDDAPRLVARAALARAVVALERGRLDAARREARLARSEHHPTDWATASLLAAVDAAVGASDATVPSSNLAAVEALARDARARGDQPVTALAESMLHRLRTDPRPRVVVPRY